MLWYDSRWGENYIGGYRRNAELADSAGLLDWSESGNAQTDGAPVQFGNAKDAIINDWVSTRPGEYWNVHTMEVESFGPDRIKVAREAENNVAYGDGHVETHHHSTAYIDAGGYVNWDGSHWVTRLGFIREIY